jgi:hypothetical protein
MNAPFRYVCKHRWLLRDDNQYECASCGLILTQQRLFHIRAIGLDVQLNEPMMLKYQILDNTSFQLFGSQNEINCFIDLAIAKREKTQK